MGKQKKERQKKNNNDYKWVEKNEKTAERTEDYGIEERDRNIHACIYKISVYYVYSVLLYVCMYLYSGNTKL